MNTEAMPQVKAAFAFGLVLMVGCSAGRSPLFWAPDRQTALGPGVLWEDPRADTSTDEASTSADGPPAPSPEAFERPLDLVALLDLALSENPQTRRTWAAARAQASRAARAEAPFFPRLEANVQGGYAHFLFQAKDSPIAIDQWQVIPGARLQWVLLDFGRRESDLGMALARLRAANLSANRAIQNVVFAVERAYYELDAAKETVVASEANLARARSVREAAQERLSHGLATRPDLLLARQAEAKAVYDLEVARVLVSDSQAALALALGVPANRAPSIVRIANRSVPESLVRDVDDLIDAALRSRPDLGARVAELRARDQAVARARADLLPEVFVDASFGQDIWWYRLDGSPRDRADEPSYAGNLGVRWSVFEGFDRINAIREARAERDEARAALEEARLDTIAQTWRAYYDFRASRKKWEYAQALLRASEEAYDSNRASYEAGLATIVQILTAERDLADALLLQIDARADLLKSAARMVWVVGEIGTENSTD